MKKTLAGILLWAITIPSCIDKNHPVSISRLVEVGTAMGKGTPEYLYS